MKPLAITGLGTVAPFALDFDAFKAGLADPDDARRRAFAGPSTALGDEKLAHVASTGAGTLVASDTGCAAHLAGLAHRKGVALRVISPAEALAESLGLLERDA